MFGEPFVPPVSDGSGQDRNLLRKPRSCCSEAGFAIKDGKRVTPSGERVHDRIPARRAVVPAASHALYQESRLLGIDATLRMVDPVQYRARVDDFDFDICVQRFSFSTTPGDSLRTYFSSQAAATKGSQNLAGIADPAIDALIDRIIAANDRPDARHRLPGARPRDPRRPLLGAALVQGVALDRLLGHVRRPPKASRAMPAAFRRPGGTMRARRRSSSAAVA